VHQKGMMTFLEVAGGAFVAAVLTQPNFGRVQTTSDRGGGSWRCRPAYAANGDLVLPKNWRHWVFVGYRRLVPNDPPARIFINVRARNAGFDIEADWVCGRATRIP
jgi:hypothetical protein